MKRVTTLLSVLAVLAGFAVYGLGIATLAQEQPKAPAGETVTSLRDVPQTQAGITLTFAPVVRKAAPAVVNVYGARVEKRARDPFFDDPSFGEFFGQRQRERVQQSVGSGVIVSADGIVVTNHHVIEGMTEVKVALFDKREFEADVILRDPRTDLAILRLKGAEGVASMALADSDLLEIGDLVLAIGNPFGVGQTVTQGIVSALARTQVGVSDYQFFIQTDAAINPGNSGGALVNSSGELVGINTAIFSRSGGNQGIGFAIPANMVKVVVENAQGGRSSVRRPWFGATLQAVTPDIAQGLGLDRPMGALVSNVVPEGPAAKAGIKRGDIIVAVKGAPIDDPDGFGYRFATQGVTGEVAMTLLRGTERSDVNVGLAPAPETPERDAFRIRGRTPFSGATALNLSPAVAEELSLDSASNGVVISEVAPRTAAAQLGFRKNDIILAINGRDINSTKILRDVLSKDAEYWRLSINRGGRIINTVLGY
jgi:Do/DeqQ family serine protease